MVLDSLVSARSLKFHNLAVFLIFNGLLLEVEHLLRLHHHNAEEVIRGQFEFTLHVIQVCEGKDEAL